MEQSEITYGPVGELQAELKRDYLLCTLICIAAAALLLFDLIWIIYLFFQIK